jgi:hypothetical protein
MHPGDCVLQPPQIRHRVLEREPGLAVIELTCPAEHPTRADHDLRLPNARLDPSCATERSTRSGRRRGIRGLSPATRASRRRPMAAPT